MKSALLSWLSTALALATLLLLPNVAAVSPVSLIISATIIWVVLILLRPLTKLVLLPFNLATFGFAGTLVHFFLLWFCLWIYPGIIVMTARVFGFYLADIGTLALLAFILSLLQRSYAALFQVLFAHKR